MGEKPPLERLKEQIFEKLFFTKFKGVIFVFFEIIFLLTYRTNLVASIILVQ